MNTKPIFIINGPNLNMLGLRQPDIYGHTTLLELEQKCCDHAALLGFSVECFQSNHEGQLIDWLHQAGQQAAGVVFNPGGYSHTSIALLDAVLAISIPVIEVHISDIDAREPFRRHSYISAAAIKVIKGQGIKGYILALDALKTALSIDT